MKSLLSLLALVILLSCSGNSVDDRNCRFLLDIGVNETINLNFYPQLKFISETQYIPGIGNGGIIISNTISGFQAFDAADPNHPLSSCSILNVAGVIGTCGCEDGNEYSLLDGTPIGNNGQSCALKAYRVEQSGNSLLIFN